MAKSSMVIVVAVFQLIFMLSCSCIAQGAFSAKFFDVTKYGAVANGKDENSNQFLRAWEDACQWDGYSVMLIPKGIFRLNSLNFVGPCKSFTAVRIVGDLKASTDVSGDTWIGFRYVKKLLVGGGGTVDGQGASVWGRNDRPRPISMVFNFVKYSKITNLNFINSKSVHLKIFASERVKMSEIRITAPENSPNTDGICIAESQDVKLQHSKIACGDDCVSLLTGTKNVEISDVTCGPGHGISVGSIGYKLGENRDNGVSGFHVKNCTFIGTTNGLRIKTWAPSDPGLVSNFMFEDIHMKNTDNPIIIDQHYCPLRNCNNQAQSSIQIKNVTFRNIWGESNTPVAVNIQCSSKSPCSEFKLQDIFLAYNGRGIAQSECLNVDGESHGHTHPAGCF